MIMMFDCFKSKKKSNKGRRGEEFDGVVPLCIDLQLIDWTRKSEGSKLIDKIKNLLGPVSIYDEQEGSGYLGLFCRHEEERPYFVSKNAFKNEMDDIIPPPPLPQLSPSMEELLNKQMATVPIDPPPPPQLSPPTEVGVYLCILGIFNPKYMERKQQWFRLVAEVHEGREDDESSQIRYKEELAVSGRRSCPRF